MIKEQYDIKDVYVIPGDSETDKAVKIELSRQAGQLVEDVLYDHAIVAVTGGSTMAYVSEAMHKQPHDVFFVPARGGLGENVVYQANTIAASMAQQTNGDYTTLYVPDNVSETTYNTLMLEPSVIHTPEKLENPILQSTALVMR